MSCSWQLRGFTVTVINYCIKIIFVVIFAKICYPFYAVFVVEHLVLPKLFVEIFFLIVYRGTPDMILQS